MRGLAFGLIGEKQLENEIARSLRTVRIGRDLHAGVGFSNAGRGKHALALDLDHAGAAIPIGPVAGQRTMAKVGDVRSAPPGGLPDRFPWKRLNFLTVEQERDALCHRELLSKLRQSGQRIIIPEAPRSRVVIPERRSLIRDRNELKRLPFCDPGSRFVWPG